MDNNYWKEKYADIHLRLTNKIAELEKENAEMQKALKTLAEGLNKRQMILQKIKKYIAKICKEECGYVQKKRCPDCDCRYGAILDLITKADEEWK